uniref:Uncharacterized protein n=1 Tax=Eutreptiella gymnastica TaxID=73025 RepID=A0A7S1I7E0_9EUGL
MSAAPEKDSRFKVIGALAVSACVAVVLYTVPVYATEHFAAHTYGTTVRVQPVAATARVVDHRLPHSQVHAPRSAYTSAQISSDVSSMHFGSVNQKTEFPAVVPTAFSFAQAATLLTRMLGIISLVYIAARRTQDSIATAAVSGKKSAPAPEPEDEDDGLLIGIGGTVANIVLYISLWTLYNTGSGLPAGPGGLYGLAEGLSYLAVPAIFGYSVYTKVQTGSGLPAGKFGLQGAAEGLSFLGIAAGIFVLISQATSG